MMLWTKAVLDREYDGATRSAVNAIKQKGLFDSDDTSSDTLLALEDKELVKTFKKYDQYLKSCRFGDKETNLTYFKLVQNSCSAGFPGIPKLRVSEMANNYPELRIAETVERLELVRRYVDDVLE